MIARGQVYLQMDLGSTTEVFRVEIIYLDWICNPPTFNISKLIWDSCPASGDLQWNAAGNINVRVGGGPSSRGLTPLRECFNEVFWWKHLYIDNWIL